MFFSPSILKASYANLIKLDASNGKSRKERVSGLRYLLATSQLSQKQGNPNINLAVGSDSRKEFVEAVGEVVALNDQGLYSKDFAKEWDEIKDYGVRSNFYTTRLASSRSQDIQYPGRPGHLLFLENEKVSILDDVGQVLLDSFGVEGVKADLCIWLLRNEEFNITDSKPPAAELLKEIEQKLRSRYTSDVVDALLCDEPALNGLIDMAGGDVLTDQRPNLPEILEFESQEEEQDVPVFAKVLTDDLPDDDKVFNIVEKLLSRGSKGILFSGPPGTSKTWYALKVALKIIEGELSRLERVQFHPSFTYEDFIEGLVSTGSGGTGDPMFEPRAKVFLKLCDAARTNTDDLYILIIDEFSRGDPSKIFGELLTYIEPDYRDIEFRLPYSEKEVSIPQNIVIFATMNPYDKSVVDLDAAMERRFEVVELLPDIEILKVLLTAGNVSGPKLGKVVNFFTKANSLSPHGFGHTYFKGVVDDGDFILLWNHKLKFIFEKMFRFKEDAYKEVRETYLDILDEGNKDALS